MIRFVSSANGLGITITVAYGLWQAWYFLLSGGWNPLDGLFQGNLGGPANFYRNFAAIAPLYLTVEALASAFSLVTTGASARGRIWGLVNLGTTIVVLIESVVLLATWDKTGIAHEKLSQVGFCVYLSVLDVVITIGTAYLVSLAMRTFGMSSQSS